MAFNSVLQMYTDWANSILCEEGILIDGLHELRDGRILCKLIDVLTSSCLSQEVKSQEPLSNIHLALDFLKQHGVKLKSTTEAIFNGELKSTLDVMWAIILHCTVHSPDVPLLQRTVRLGKQTLLEWFNRVVPESQVHLHSSLNQCFCGNNNLATLIGKFISFTLADQKKDVFVVNLTNALLAAEDKFGLVKTLISPSDVIIGTIDEHSIMIYLALLHRKVVRASSVSSSSLQASSNDLGIAQHEIYNLASTSHSFKFLNRGRRSRICTIMQNSVMSDTMVDEKSLDAPAAVRDAVLIQEEVAERALQHLQSDVHLESVIQETAGPLEAVLPDIKITATRNIERMLEERRLDFELDEEKMDGRSVQSFQRRVGRAKTPEDELLNILDAIAKACRHLKKELDQSQLRELYLIQELQNREEDTSQNDVIPKLVQELQVLRNENRRLFREAVIIKTEGTHNKKLVERLECSVDRLQAEVDHLSAENHRLKLTKTVKTCSEGVLKSRGSYFDLPQNKRMQDLKSTEFINECNNEGNYLNKELEFELRKVTENLKKSQNELLRLKQEKRLLKMTADTSRLEATTNLKRCQRLESLLVYAENNIGFGRAESSAVSQEAKTVPDVAADAKYLDLLKKLDGDNVLLRERLLLAEEDREILREEVRQYRINASLVQQRHLMSFALQSDELYSSSEDGRFLRRKDHRCSPDCAQGQTHSGDYAETASTSAGVQSLSVCHVNAAEGTIRQKGHAGNKTKILASDTTSEGTEILYDCTDSESMELLHIKLKTQIRSDTSSSVSGFSMDSKDDVFPALPSPVRKSTVSLSSVEDVTSSIDDGQGFNQGRRMSLGGFIVSNAEKSPPRHEESTTRGKSIVPDVSGKNDRNMFLDFPIDVEDSEAETTLTQDCLNINSPRLALGTSHILKNTLAHSEKSESSRTISSKYNISSTPNSMSSTFPALTDVKKTLYSSYDDLSSDVSNVDSDEEFKQLPDQIEDPERLHDTSPKSITSRTSDNHSGIFRDVVQPSEDLNCDRNLQESLCTDATIENRLQEIASIKSNDMECQNSELSRVKGVEDMVVEGVISASGSGLTMNNHSPTVPIGVYRHKPSLSPRDQQYANSIIDKYLRLLPITPK